MSLNACGGIHQGLERFVLVMTPRKTGDSYVFGCSSMRVIFAGFVNEARCQDIDQVLLHGDHFLLSAFSSSFFSVLGENTSIRSKLPTAVCSLREKREEGVKSTCFLYLIVSFWHALAAYQASLVEPLFKIPMARPNEPDM